MSVAGHAENILSAWAIEDYRRFDAEVESALAACKTARHDSQFDFERREVLSSVAEHLERSRLQAPLSESKLLADLTLLRHLAGYKYRTTRFTIFRHQTCDKNLRGQLKAVRRGQ